MDTNATGESPDLLSDTGYLCVGIYLSILGLSSICVNGFVILILLKGKAKHNVMHNILLLNMAVTDFLISIVAYPLSASSSLHGSLAVGNMNTLAVIAICRYIIAVRPEYSYLLEKKNAKYILCMIWIYSFMWTSPPLVGWSTYTFEAYRTSCTINWAGRSILDKTYNITITVTCFIVHVSICSFSYFHVIKRHAWANNSDIGLALRSSGRNLEATERTFNLETVVSYHKVTTSRKVTMMCFAMLTSYLIAWTPYTFLSVWIMFIGDVKPWVHVLPTMMAKSSTLTNAIVYGILSSKFRESVKLMFKRNMNRVAPMTTNINRNLSEPVATSSRVQSTGTTLQHRPQDHSKKEHYSYKTYSVHLIKNDVYIGKNNVTLPNEERVL
ncbi:pinopsin-like isoform X2 [Pecten maximus]|uniref:pinopsin-like isoform X2 n=1 Tax=Pecten maximus TaxID=6579 RepID=UPI0014586476|nr:pinopsin-like isoform X2 [Pecten maximus]